MAPYINWLGFYTFERANESPYPHRWVVVGVNNKFFRIESEHLNHFPLDKANKFMIFLVQNNLNSHAIIDYLKQQIDNDT